PTLSSAGGVGRGVEVVGKASSAGTANSGSAKYPTSARDGDGRCCPATSWYQDQTACPNAHPVTPTSSRARQSQASRCRPARWSRSPVHPHHQAANTAAASCEASSTTCEG